MDTFGAIAVLITREELAALSRVLATQVQRAVYEPDRQIRGETAAIEAFLDRAFEAHAQAQNQCQPAARGTRRPNQSGRDRGPMEKDNRAWGQ